MRGAGEPQTQTFCAFGLPWPVSEHAEEQASAFSVHHFPGKTVSGTDSDHFQCFDHVSAGQSHSPKTFSEIVGINGCCSLSLPLGNAVYEVTTALA